MSTEQANTTSQQQIAEIQELASLVKNLNNMVSILNESIDVFKFGKNNNE